MKHHTFSLCRAPGGAPPGGPRHVPTGMALLWALAATANGQQIRLLTEKHDPYGFPRPGAGQQHVPLRTSFYLELGFDGDATSDVVLPASVAVRLEPDNDAWLDLVRPGPQFAPGYTGSLRARVGAHGESILAVYVSGDVALRPATRYTVQVSANSRKGAKLPPGEGTWSFTTEAEPLTHDVTMSLDLGKPPVRWHGGFFTGFCKPSFCNSEPGLISTYELMAEARKEYPKAWSLQRDFWMTGMDDRPGFLSPMLPNVVRERETRRITSIRERPDGLLLHVEDFFGHGQYGIPAGRPVSEDYRAGDEVLIADGTHDARVRVLRADDRARTVLVTRTAAPPGGWLLDYAAPLPSHEDPSAPGLFPWGGCYLRKFSPSGTPCYYWGRIDREWDVAHKRFGRRLAPNFADAPGDLSIDGRNWTTAKDYAQLHEVVRVMTDHLIGRYGDACLDFVWSVFNEPDLGAAFWRSDWNELQKFYDYTTDAVLRAFEDRGLDSSRVFIGGLELGAIFGVNLKLREFLIHCSPRAEGKGALLMNAAFADRRLDGRRSRRVEDLCRAHGGRGAPCDFISIHAYNRSELMAAKLARAREIALEIDSDYYARLWVNSHESCPGWNPPADPAAADSYLGNGYFPTWCADVAARQLRRAHADARYAFGETILTFWHGPTQNFDGLNNCTRLVNVDDDGDGRLDRKVLVPMPIFHFLNLLSSMGDEYRVLPEQICGGHVVGGFASRTERDVRLLLYAHHALDTESRSERMFRIAIDLAGIPWPRVNVREYRFDREHNTYFRLARQLRDRPLAMSEKVDADVRVLAGDDREAKLQALRDLADMGAAARPALPALLEITGGNKDPEVLAAGKAAMERILASPVCYSPQEVDEVLALSKLRVTASYAHAKDSTGRLTLSVSLTGNAADFLIIEPAEAPCP